MSIENNVETIVDEMVIDTGDFDIFSSLDDLVEETIAPQENSVNEDVAEDTPVEEAATEEETEYEDFDFDFDKIEDEDYDENGHEIDKEESEDEVEEVEEEAEELEEDGEVEDEVEYEGYMVTLPNGEEVNLAEAVAGYRNAEVLTEQQAKFEDIKEQFKEQSANTMSYLKLAKLESDRVIDDYKDFDWAALAKEDPQAYVENKEFLERYQSRRKEIAQAMDAQNQEAETAKQDEFNLRAQSCVATLKNDIPGWSNDMYQDLMNYAIDNGAVEDEILNCVDPTIFKVLHKAKQFDKGAEVVKAKVKKKVGTPKKVVKAAAKQVNQSASAKQALLEKKLASGDVSDMDLFANLLD